MLTLTIPKSELFNSQTMEFINIKETTIQLEHSLVSLAKWESEWKVPFISNERLTTEQTRSYIKHMTLTQNMDSEVYKLINHDQFAKVFEYINDPMTATKFSDRSSGPKSREVITAEIIYYRMILYGIPMECQKWHLNRLLTLIKVCDLKNGPEQKMSKSEVLKMNKSINDQRLQKLGTKG